MALSSSNFKLIFLGIFAVAAIAGILVFSGIISIGGTSGTAAVEGTAVVWGTFDSRSLDSFIQDFNTRNQKIKITYTQKDAATLDHDLVEAIAAGAAPDLVLMPDNLLYRFSDKLTHIPYASLPAQTFNATFVDGASIFSATDGSLAIPFAADPLVLYYNKDMLNSIGVAKPPTSWKDIVATIPDLTKKDSDQTIIQSAVALGSYKNIAHAKDILALLAIENGNPFVTNSATGPVAHFGSGTGNEGNAVQDALNFYLAFADPTTEAYSWNSGLPLDRDAFLQGTLAYYLGTASELPGIHAQNPNLNFDVMLPPQTSATPVTTGHMYGLAIPKTASNQLLSYTVATLLASATTEQALTDKAGATLALIPVRRDVLANKPASDPYLGLLYNTVLVMKPWFDPNPVVSDQVFSSLVTDSTSGLLSVDQALTKAASQLIAQSKAAQ